MVASSDYQLGREIAQLLCQADQSGVPNPRVLNHLPDYLGSDSVLLAPLRDLLMRPSLRNLMLQDQNPTRLSGRDSLIADLQFTYSGAIADRLHSVLNGILNLPDTATQKSWAPTDRAQDSTAYSTSNPSQQPPNTHYTYTIQPAATGQSGLNAALIALLAVLSGGAMVGLFWLLVSQSQLTRQVPPTASQPSSTTTAATPPTPQRLVSTSTSSTPWASAEEYKFGQGPSQSYPNTCAFSQTDARGEQTLTNKSQLEFWACRDEGGNSDSGYAVTWGDGKRTTYQFRDGGSGLVVGTNGQDVPMRWRNDSHNGQQIIVISHQDGATSWIPGHVGD